MISIPAALSTYCYKVENEKRISILQKTLVIDGAIAIIFGVISSMAYWPILPAALGPTFCVVEGAQLVMILLMNEYIKDLKKKNKPLKV